MQYPQSFNEGGTPDEVLGGMGMDEKVAQGMSQISGAFRAEVAAQVAAMDKQDPEALEQLLELVGYINQSPDKYPQILRSLIKQDIIDEGDFPAEMDRAYFTILEAVLQEALAKETRGYAEGGLAALAKKGRNGDTQLAHITKDEAQLLRAMGGSGTINPETGLPEFFLKKIFKVVKGAVKDVGKVVGGVMEDLGPIGDIAAIIPSPIQPFAQAGKAIAAANKGDWLTAVTAGIPAVSGMNSALDLGMSADTLNTIRTAGNVIGAGAALQSGDVLAALSRAIQIPEIASILPGEIGGIPTKTILQGAGAISQATRGNYFNAIFGAMEAAGLQKIPGTEISINDAKRAVGALGATGVLGSSGPGIAGTPAAQARPPVNPAGISALLGASAVARTTQQQQLEDAMEAKRRAEEARFAPTELFSTNMFARPMAGGGMAKRFDDGGEVYVDPYAGAYDGGFAAGSVLDSSGSVPSVPQSDLDFEQDWADVIAGRPTVNDVADQFVNLPSSADASSLMSIFNSLTDAAKKLYMTNGKVDFGKLAAIAGGVYGASQANKQNLSSIGFSGQIPQLTAARAQAPFEYDAQRRPGSAGRRYMSDMIYGNPEDRAALVAKAQEQAKGIAALQRNDGSMRNAIAPGGYNPSPSYSNPGLEALYQGILGRGADYGGMAYWDRQFGNEIDDAERRQWLTGAQDEQAKQLGAGATVEDIYRQYLGRQGDQAGVDYWKQQFGGTVDANELRQFLTGAQDEYLQQINSGAGYARPSMAMPTTPSPGAVPATDLEQFAYAAGGPARDPKYLRGSTNGQADEIQTTIDGAQPALLSHGEFVVPADVVSALGGGNSESGAEVLYSMMDRVRQQAFGRKKQMNKVNPGKVMPA